MQEGIDLGVEGAAATLTLNNPKRHNALTRDSVERVVSRNGRRQA